MKRSAKQLKRQMNLPLFNAPATKVPNHKQKELALTLMELPAAATSATAQAGRLGWSHRPDSGRRQGAVEEAASYGQADFRTAAR